MILLNKNPAIRGPTTRKNTIRALMATQSAAGKLALLLATKTNPIKDVHTCIDQLHEAVILLELLLVEDAERNEVKKFQI